MSDLGITFTLAPSDFTALHRTGMLHHPAIQRSLAIRALVIVGLAILLTALLTLWQEGPASLLHRHTFYIAAGLAVIPGVLMVAGFYYLNAGNLPYRAFIRHFGKEALNQTLTLCEDGIRQQRAVCETLWRFSAFDRILDQNRHVYLLFLSGQPRALIIPRRAFATADDERRFMDALRQRIAKPVGLSGG